MDARKTFKQFCNRARKCKTAVGHSLPNVARNYLTAAGVYGRLKNPDNEPDFDRLKHFRKQLLSNKHKLPKFPNS